MKASHIRVVLVRTEVAGNIGSTARVMANFGFGELVLVNPVADPLSEEAVRRATHGEAVLRAARRVASMDDALTGCLASAAATARRDGLAREGRVGLPAEVLPSIARWADDGPVALVFGPEPSGLTNAEIARCDQLLSIPTEPACPALNLSHAVAVCLYELIRCGPSVGRREPPAPDEEREAMFQHLRSSLEAVHFLWNEKAEMLFNGLRQVIARAEPTHKEVMVLHGVAAQLEWVVRHCYRAPDTSTN
jgi:TrmH family RNA methyltransferase